MRNNTITWSAESITILEDILDYIYAEWGINTVIDFQNELNSLLKAICKNHRLCPASKVIGFRKCVLSKQTSLIYRFSKSKLEIVTFIDNRSNHMY